MGSNRQTKYALLVIDIQHWFFRTGERKAGLPKLIPMVNELIDVCDRAEIPIIHVLTIMKADGSDWNLYMKRENEPVLIEGTKEAEELEEISRSPSHERLVKTRGSAFLRTDLDDRLRALDVTALILSGVFTHGCVGRTGLAAYEYDYEVVVASDAIFSHQAERAEFMLREMERNAEARLLSNSEIGALLGVRT